MVEQAKGVLMQRESLSEEEVYLCIQRQVRRERRPMRQVAEAILREARDFLTEQRKCSTLLIDAFSKRRASRIRGAKTLGKRKSIVPLNLVEEASEKYSEFMPAITDVRGEE